MEAKYYNEPAFILNARGETKNSTVFENLEDVHFLKQYLHDTCSLSQELTLSDTIRIKDYFYPSNLFFIATYKSGSDSYRFVVGSNVWTYNGRTMSTRNCLCPFPEVIFPLSKNLKFSEFADYLIWKRLFWWPTLYTITDLNDHNGKDELTPLSGNTTAETFFKKRSIKVKRYIQSQKLERSFYGSYFRTVLECDYGDVQIKEFDDFFNTGKFSFTSNGEDFTLTFSKLYPFCYKIKAAR